MLGVVWECGWLAYKLAAATPLFTRLGSVLCVVGVVTPLAKGGEVAEVASLGAVIVDMSAS